MHECHINWVTRGFNAEPPKTPPNLSCTVACPDFRGQAAGRSSLNRQPTLDSGECIVGNARLDDLRRLHCDERHRHARRATRQTGGDYRRKGGLRSWEWNVEIVGCWNDQRAKCCWNDVGGSWGLAGLCKRPGCRDPVDSVKPEHLEVRKESGHSKSTHCLHFARAPIVHISTFNLNESSFLFACPDPPFAHCSRFSFLSLVVAFFLSSTTLLLLTFSRQNGQHS